MKLTTSLAAVCAVLTGQHLAFAQVSHEQKPTRPVRRVSGQPQISGFNIIRVSGEAGKAEVAGQVDADEASQTDSASEERPDRSTAERPTLNQFSEEFDLVEDKFTRFRERPKQPGASFSEEFDLVRERPSRRRTDSLPAVRKVTPAPTVATPQVSRDPGGAKPGRTVVEDAVYSSDASDSADVPGLPEEAGQARHLTFDTPATSAETTELLQTAPTESTVKRTSWLNFFTRSQSQTESVPAADCAPDAPAHAVTEKTDCTPDGGCASDAGCRAGVCELSIFEKCQQELFPSCDPCNPCRPCYSLWGEVLFLSPRDVGFGYAQHVDGPTQNASPLAPLNMVDPDYQMGFRVGGAYHPDRYSKIGAEYWYFRSDTDDAIDLPGGTGFINSLVTHPSTDSVGTDSLIARGQLDVDFDIVDVNFEENLFRSCGTDVSGVVGFRYARLDQDFQGDFLIDGATTVRSSTEFHGFGPRGGLKIRREFCGGFHVYGQGFFDVLAGQFQSDYSQENIMVGNQVRSGFEDDRLVPQLESELGFGFDSPCGNFTLRAGYFMGAWFNTVTTAEFIEGVRANNFSDDNIDESLTFDGLTFRALFRF